MQLVCSNIWEWLSCRCDMHLLYVGLAVAQVDGYAPRMVLEMAGQLLADWLDDNPDEPQPDLGPFLALVAAVAENRQQPGDA